MFISRKEYDQLVREKKINIELNKEVQRLAAVISASNKDCNVGVWCKDCEHLGKERSEIREYTHSEFLPYYTTLVDGEVIYCKKHLHEICPEHTLKAETGIIKLPTK